jgi:hypothetical protein
VMKSFPAEAGDFRPAVTAFRRSKCTAIIETHCRLLAVLVVRVI